MVEPLMADGLNKQLGAPSRKTLRKAGEFARTASHIPSAIMGHFPNGLLVAQSFWWLGNHSPPGNGKSLRGSYPTSL